MFAIGLNFFVAVRAGRHVPRGVVGSPAEVRLQADDSNWYGVRVREYSNGRAALRIGQEAGSAGSAAYLVINCPEENEGAGARYKVGLKVAGGKVTYKIETVETEEAETPTVLSVNGREYAFQLVRKSGRLALKLVKQ